MYCEIHFLIFIHFLVELLPPRGELLLGHTGHAELLEVGHVLLLADVDAAGKHRVRDEVPPVGAVVERRDGDVAAPAPLLHHQGRRPPSLLSLLLDQDRFWNWGGHQGRRWWWWWWCRRGLNWW